MILVFSFHFSIGCVCILKKLSEKIGFKNYLPICCFCSSSFFLKIWVSTWSYFLWAWGTLSICVGNICQLGLVRILFIWKCLYFTYILQGYFCGILNFVLTLSTLIILIHCPLPWLLVVRNKWYFDHCSVVYNVSFFFRCFYAPFPFYLCIFSNLTLISLNYLSRGFQGFLNLYIFGCQQMRHIFSHYFFR